MVVQFEATFDAQIFDKDKFNAQVKENIQNNMKMAASKFLEEAILRVPTFGGPRHSNLSTGFAIGAFTGLQEAVGDLIKIKMPRGGNISNLLNQQQKKQLKDLKDKEKQRQQERADKKAQAKKRIEE